MAYLDWIDFERTVERIRKALMLSIQDNNLIRERMNWAKNNAPQAIPTIYELLDILIGPDVLAPGTEDTSLLGRRASFANDPGERSLVQAGPLKWSETRSMTEKMDVMAELMARQSELMSALGMRSGPRSQTYNGGLGRS